MSNFLCKECGTEIIDTPAGYVTGCEHYPLPVPDDPCPECYVDLSVNCHKMSCGRGGGKGLRLTLPVPWARKEEG